MAIVLIGQVTACWVPDGSGPEFVASAQALTVACGYPPLGGVGTVIASTGLTNYVPDPVVVPGTNNAPTSGNISSAMTTLAAQLAAKLNTTTNLGIIDGWATGNP